VAELQKGNIQSSVSGKESILHFTRPRKEDDVVATTIEGRSEVKTVIPEPANHVHPVPKSVSWGGRVVSLSSQVYLV